MGARPAAVSIRGLVKRYEGVTAVDRLDLAVPAGICFGLLGPNGAGKTTTMRILHGLIRADAGEVEVLGLPMPRAEREVKALIGIVPQENNLDPDLTVLDNLLSHARFFGISPSAARARAAELLSFMELSEKAPRRVDELSGGMKRRLLIARALMNDPALVVLDEPTTGLDPQARLLVWERLASLKRSGKTLLLTTHYMEEAQRLCDDLVIMHQGRIIARGAPKDLIETHVVEHLEDVFLKLAGRRLAE